MATPVSYVPLEGNFMSSIGAGASFKTTDSPSLFTSSSFIYTFAFVVIVVVASFRYAYAGMLRMQASEKGISDSKAEFKRVTYGLLGVFGLWLILFTVNKDMLTGDVSLSGLRTSSVVGGGSLISVPPSTQTGVTANSGSHTYAERLASHNTVVARLAPSNIHTNHGDASCSEAQFGESKPSCTSLAFLPEETIKLLLIINGSCKCTIIITGGTEPGHATHGEGRRAVDLQITSSDDALYTYIKNTMQNFSNISPCNIKYIWSSFTFWDENVGCSKGNTGRHWHIS